MSIAEHHVQSMTVADFDYHLPSELVARYPLEQRSRSRLLCLDREGGRCIDRQFSDIIKLIQPGDLLVLNNTKVIAARLFGEKSTGGKIEILIERVLDDHTCLAHIRSSKSPKPGSILHIDDYQLQVTERQDALFHLEILGEVTLWDCLQDCGQIPLPPYLNREPEKLDIDRYQTIYAENAGAVAAPTAGLHFDQYILDQLSGKGVELAYLTLHVGAGTFQPVRVEKITDHQMHAEYIEVSQQVADTINATKQRGKRVIAVGTTTVRAIESATEKNVTRAFFGDTDIFIYPGYQFRIVDAMLTNFHLPKSTLMMLVSAFAGYDHVMNAYRHAVEQEYRFYSYGDAMYISSEVSNAV